MALRNVALVLAALLVIGAGDSPEAHNRWCERVCSCSRRERPTPCPAIPPCPSNSVNISCPENPPCPSPVVKFSFPEVSSCPSPIVNLSCPEIPPYPVVNISCPEIPPYPVVNISCPEPRHSNPPPSPPPGCPVCEAPPKCVPTTSTFLPIGYQRFPGVGSYKFYSTMKTWPEANQTCTNDGGYLAIPDTPVEHAIIMRMIKVAGTDAYIGFHDFTVEGSFKTSIGQPMSAFQDSLWVPSQPDGGTDQNGVYMQTDGRIRDFSNTGKEEFVCELPHLC